MRRNNNDLWAVTAWIVGMLISLGTWGIIIWVVIHFIRKFW